MTTERDAHLATPGHWPVDFPTDAEGGVEEGLVVWPQSGTIEGRTTGSRRRCESFGCPGWFIGVNWESEQHTWFPCSEGWHFDPDDQYRPDHWGRRDLGAGHLPGAARASPVPAGRVARPSVTATAKGLAGDRHRPGIDYVTDPAGR